MPRETMTSEAESQFKKPSLARKTLMSVLGGIGIFAASNIYGAAAGVHNDQIRDARAQEARQFDLSRAKASHVINLNEDGEEIDEEGVIIETDKNR